MVKVAIYGGGIGGLSAAHELIKRGYDVDVYEASDSLGGKARSQMIAHTGTDGRLDLPGEHGFRFFPAFYLHLNDTMQDTPAGTSHVLARLRGSDEFAIANGEGHFTRASRRIGSGAGSLSDLWHVVSVWFDRDGLALTRTDLAMLTGALIRMWTSCEERRQAEHDLKSWFEYAQAQLGSPRYQRLTSALPRTMVAMDGRSGSAYTIGKVASQLFVFDSFRSMVDRVLDGPTTLRWLDPWEAHLRSQGVRFHLNMPLTALHLEHGRIASAVVGNSSVEADYHICAVPIEIMQRLITDPIAAAAPSLKALRDNMKDPVDWMVGAQYYLDRDVPMCKGHVIYTDSPWALSSISQPQFWESGGQFSEKYGNGSVRGLISVDISDWLTEAPRLGKPAIRCTPQEILREVFEQLLDGARGIDGTLSYGNVVDSKLDSNISWDPAAQMCRNTTPLLVHRPGHWQHRPDALTEIPNLMLAADYVRTYTNLATMEGANEAARRAVRGIISASGVDADLPNIYPMDEPAFLDTFKALDRWLYRQKGINVNLFDLADDDKLEVLRQARQETALSLDNLRSNVQASARRRRRDGEEDVSPEIESLRRVLDTLAKDVV